jgi:outer membrane receptor protein involved in Fe transport
MRKFPLLMSVAFAAMSAPAFAQTAPQGDAAADSGEIIVTATRRSESLSDVPLAVSAVTSESLQNSGANDIRSLNQLAPSLLVSSTGSEANGSARIRGVGTVGDNPGLESSVAVFVDGVYRSRSGAGMNEMGEVERIEVLRGPQGTLFGRNASAGLIHIISKKPSFDFGANVEASYGNYDYYRIAGGVTGPISEKIAARVDAVYSKRDGFYKDTNNSRTVNNRDRYFVKGQILFEPSDAVSLRLIADYSKKSEECCAAVYLDGSVEPKIGGLNDPAQNNIIRVLTALGQSASAFSNPYSRNISVTPGRSFAGKTTDGGVSGELNWDFGGANLTSITAYRQYKSAQGSDTDYSTVDILYLAPDGNSSRQFKTFSQELRLQGSAFDDKIDWLVGGYFANEKLTTTDNLRFGNQYGRFATCRLISGGGLAALYSPTSAGCLAARPAAFGAASPVIYAAIDRMDGMNNVGSTRDVYNQTSRNMAVFTHNIIHLSDKFSITLGARYTSERKKFAATFGNDNSICTAQQAALTPFLTNASLAAVAGGIIGLSCQGNSTAELNGVSINSKRKESEFTGTAVASYKVNDDLMVYGSASRGYKAGGFNLDRSALKAPTATFASLGGAQALVGNLQFDPEIVMAYELGAKYSSRQFSVSVAAFRQQFKNFQLNTFNGSVFLVQTVNGCGTDLAGTDRDLSAATGTCAAGDVSYGVLAQGVELETSLRPARNLTVNMGLTYASTKYRNNLVGNKSGAPLDPALRKLPGDNLSNAPELVATASLAWTPEIGSNGMTGLVYFDTRLSGDYNTGSDLFPQKEQDSYAVVNGRIGLRGPDEKWGIEFWAQNIFKKNYTQIAFNTPFQAGGASAAFVDPQFPGGRQIFSAFLAEPRTYGITLRGKF